MKVTVTHHTLPRSRVYTATIRLTEREYKALRNSDIAMEMSGTNDIVSAVIRETLVQQLDEDMVGRGGSLF